MPSIGALKAFGERRGTDRELVRRAEIKDNLASSENFGLDTSQAKAILAESALRLGAAGGSILSAVGLYDRADVDEINRRADDYGLAADELFLERTGSKSGQFVNRSVRQAGTSAITSIPVAFSTPALIAGQSLMAANQAFTQAKDAGLSDGAATGFAFGTGAIEGLITSTFQKFGLGGLESGFKKQILKDISSSMTRKLGQYLANAGKNIAAEELEEISILYAQTALEQMSGVDTRGLDADEVAQVALTTLLSSGAGALAQGISKPNSDFNEGLLSGQIASPTAVSDIDAFEAQNNQSMDAIISDKGNLDGITDNLSSLSLNEIKEQVGTPPTENETGVVTPDAAAPASIAATTDQGDVLLRTGQKRAARPGEIDLANRDDLQPSDLSDTQIEDTLDQMEPALRDIVGEDADISRTKSGFIVQRPGGSKVGVFIVSRDEAFKRAGRANPVNSYNSLVVHGALPIVNKKRLTLDQWRNMKPAAREALLRKNNIGVGGFTISNPQVGSVPIGVNSAIFMTEGDVDVDTLMEEHGHDIFRTLLTDEEINQIHDELLRKGVLTEALPEGKRRRDNLLVEQAFQAYNEFLTNEAAPEPGPIAQMFQRIKNFFGRIKNAILRTEEVDNGDALRGLFQSIQSGEVGTRAPIAGETSQATVFEEREASATKERRGQRREKKSAAKFVTEEERARIKSTEAEKTSDVRAEQARISDEILENTRELNAIEETLADQDADPDSFDVFIERRKELKRINSELRAEKTALGARRSAEAAEIRAEQIEEDVDLTQGDEAFAIRKEDLGGRQEKSNAKKAIAPENISADAAAAGLGRAFQAETPEGQRLESEFRAQEETDEDLVVPLTQIENEGQKLLNEVTGKELVQNLEARMRNNEAADFFLTRREVAALRLTLRKHEKTIINNAGRFPRAAKAAQDSFFRTQQLLEAGGSEQARILRTFRGQNTPEERMATAIANAQALSTNDQRKVNREREKDAAAADKLNEKLRSRNLARFRTALTARGIDPADMTPEKFGDDAFNLQVQKAANLASQGRKRGAIINGLLTQNVLGLTSIAQQIPGGVMATIAQGGQATVEAAINQLWTSITGKSLDTLPLPADLALALKAGIEHMGAGIMGSATAFLEGRSLTQERLGKGVDIVERTEGFKDPTADLPTIIQVLLNPVFRSMSALDEMIMAPVAASATVMHALRIGRSRGLSGEALAKFVRDQSSLNTLDPEVAELAINSAEDITFKRPFQEDTVAGRSVRAVEKLRNEFGEIGGFKPLQPFALFMRGLVRLSEFSARRAPASSLAFLINDVAEARFNPGEDAGNLKKRTQATRQLVSTLLAHGLGLLLLGLDDEEAQDLTKGMIGDVDVSRADPVGLAAKIQGLVQQVARGKAEARETADQIFRDTIIKPSILDDLAKLASERKGVSVVAEEQLSREIPGLGESGIVRDFKRLGSPEDKTRKGVQKREAFGGQKKLRRDPGALSATAELFGFRIKSKVDPRTKAWITWTDRTSGIKNTPFIVSSSFAEKNDMSDEDKDRFAELAGQKYLRLLESSRINPKEDASDKDIKKARALRTKALNFAKAKF